MITTCIDALQEEAECVPFKGLTVNILAVRKRCRRDGCRFCWEPFGGKPTYADPHGVDIPILCLLDSDVAAIGSSSSRFADNVRSKLKRSPCMQAVRFCCPAYGGTNVADQSPDGDAFQSLCRDESADIVLHATPNTLEIVEQGGGTSSEAVDAELVPAIELAVELYESADVSVLEIFIRTFEGCKIKFDAEVDDDHIPFPF